MIPEMEEDDYRSSNNQFNQGAGVIQQQRVSNSFSSRGRANFDSREMEEDDYKSSLQNKFNPGVVTQQIGNQNQAPNSTNRGELTLTQKKWKKMTTRAAFKTSSSKEEE